MLDAYNLKAYPLGGQRIYALSRVSTGVSCVDELLDKGDPNDLLGMSARSLAAIRAHGMRYATTHSLVRRLSDNVYLVEFKSRRTAWRMAAYIHGSQGTDTIPVLLEPFQGHKGKTGRISSKKIKALEEKARIAKELIERECEDGNL